MKNIMIKLNRSMSELQLCVVEELGKCGEPTPANIVESLFEFVRRSTPCIQFQSAKVQKSSSASLQSMISVIPLSSLTIIFGRFGYE